MIRWLLCLLLGVAVAWLAYGRSSATQRSRMVLLGIMRALAVALVAALLVGAPAGRARRVAPLIALDASASWRRAAGADSARWLDALRTAVTTASTDTVLLVGDSLREVNRAQALSHLPADNASTLRPLVDRASALGRTLVLITDGEADDGAVVDELPSGSRIIVPAMTARTDVAVASIESPASATAGDTLQVGVLVIAGGTGAPAGEIRLIVDGRQVGAIPSGALAAYASRRVTLPLALPRGTRTSVVQAAVVTPGDVEPRNDTAAVSVEIGDRPPVVFVSTAPDLDVREVLTVLRGSLDVPAKAYLRLAPGVWREEGSLAAISEADVLSRAKSAGLVIVHGDTTWGGLASVNKGARALWTPAPAAPPARAGEMQRTPDWYATGAPPSPLAGALAGLPWDTLPPLNVATPARGEFTVLEARIGRAGTPVPIVAGREKSGARTLVITGSGFSGWSLRGGRSADAFTALWGAIFDWLAAARSDARAALPVLMAVRAGEPIAWRRGSGDSVVTAVVTKRAATPPARSDTLQLHFTDANGTTTSPALTQGIYDIRVVGGTAVLVVNANREWIPRAATVSATSATFGAVPSDVPLLSELGWPFVLALLLLSGEWLGRRWAGLR